MGGWEFPFRDFAQWDGVIKAKAFLGDGSGLTGVAGGGAVDSVFGRTGVVVAATDDYTWAQVNKATSNIADITTKSHTSLTDIGTNAHTTIDTHIADATIHFASDAIWTAINLRASSSAYTTHAADATIHFTSGAIWAGLNATAASGATTSGAYYTHAASTAIHNASAALIAILSTSGAVIASGSYVDIVVPFNCTIRNVVILPDTSGSLTVNVKKCTYANFPGTLTRINDFFLTSTTKSTTADSGTLTSSDVLRVIASGAATSVAQATIGMEVQKS